MPKSKKAKIETSSIDFNMITHLLCCFTQQENNDPIDMKNAQACISTFFPYLKNNLPEAYNKNPIELFQQEYRRKKTQPCRDYDITPQEWLTVLTTGTYKGLENNCYQDFLLAHAFANNQPVEDKLTPQFKGIALGYAADNGDLETVKKIVKTHPDIKPEDVCSAVVCAITEGHYHCVKYLIDTAWQTFSDNDKRFIAGMAAHAATKDSKSNDALRESTKSLALILKKYTPTLPEGTVHKIKAQYPKAFEKLNALSSAKLNTEKPSPSFLPMFKNSTEKLTKVQPDNTILEKKPIVMVNILEDSETEMKRKKSSLVN